VTAAAVKRRVGRAAADELVRSGMRVGLGTGSTAIEVVRRVAELLSQGGLRRMLFVPTSMETEAECGRLGIPLVTLNDPRLGGELDLTIDGADEVDPAWRLVKGGGAAMLAEKVVAAVSRRYAIVIDRSKIVSRLGERAPVPVEVVREARVTAAAALVALGGVVELRMAVRKDGPVVTDHGNLVLDVRFARAFDPAEMERDIAAIPGVVASGIFTVPVSDLFVGASSGVVRHERGGVGGRSPGR
jgi:ribose 5-phosphate isomerase A